MVVLNEKMELKCKETVQGAVNVLVSDLDGIHG